MLPPASEDRPVPRTKRKSTGWISEVIAQPVRAESDQFPPPDDADRPHVMLDAALGHRDPDLPG